MRFAHFVLSAPVLVAAAILAAQASHKVAVSMRAVAGGAAPRGGGGWEAYDHPNSYKDLSRRYEWGPIDLACMTLARRIAATLDATVSDNKKGLIAIAHAPATAEMTFGCGARQYLSVFSANAAPAEPFRQTVAIAGSIFLRLPKERIGAMAAACLGAADRDIGGVARQGAGETVLECSSSRLTGADVEISFEPGSRSAFAAMTGPASLRGGAADAEPAPAPRQIGKLSP